MSVNMNTMEVSALKRIHTDRDAAHEALQKAERIHGQLEQQMDDAWKKLSHAQQLVYTAECGGRQLTHLAIPPPKPPEKKP